eukprot:6462447-Amphidinium_carterae.1
MPVPSGHIKLDTKFGRPPALAGDGKNWEEFAFKRVAHAATFQNNVSALLRSSEKRSEDQSAVMTALNEQKNSHGIIFQGNVDL